MKSLFIHIEYIECFQCIYYANIMHRKFVFFNKYIGHSKNSKGPVFPPAMGHWDIGTWPGGLAQPGRKKKPLRFETQKK
jgi:hypothetical protein